MKPYGGKRNQRCSVKGHGLRCVVAQEMLWDQKTGSRKSLKKRARQEAKKECRSGQQKDYSQ